MDEDQINRIRLEERARILSKQVDEVQNMLKIFATGSDGDKKSPNPETKPKENSQEGQNKNKFKKPQQNRGAQSLADLIDRNQFGMHNQKPKSFGNNTRQFYAVKNNQNFRAPNISNFHKTNQNFRGPNISNFHKNNQNFRSPNRATAPPSYEEALYGQNAPPLFQNKNEPPNFNPHPLNPFPYSPQTYVRPNLPNFVPPRHAPPQPATRFSKNPTKFASLNLKDLIKELTNINSSGFFAPVMSLSSKLNRNNEEVLKVIINNSGIFSTIEEKGKVIVELCPKVSLCQDHLGSGCQTQKCRSLHVCEDYVNGVCSIKMCPYGHSWMTDHNTVIFRNFCLDSLPYNILQNLMRKTLADSTIPKVCTEYNQKNCNLGNDCQGIHICLSFVNTLGNCTNSDCSLSHVVLDPKCIKCLRKIGVSLNESPRDLLKVLKENCLEKESEKVNQPKGTKKSIVKKKNASSDVKNSSTETVKSKHGHNVNKEKSGSVFVWDFHGNVEIPFICIPYMKGKCDKLHTGCKYLHSNKTSYYWQFGNDSKWYNFHIYHAQILETKYKDVNCDEVLLPTLDPTKIQPRQKDLLSLLGNKSVKVDFRNMTVDCESSKMVFSVRHITTQSSVVCDNVLSTVFNWYFKNDQGNWELYGGTDSSSLSLEKSYLQNPKGTHTFISGVTNFQYLVDFDNMTQSNTKTNKIRPIRRRPDPTAPSEAPVDKFKLPNNWEEMSGSEEYKLVKLSSGSDEYKDVLQKIKRSLPLSNIINVYRNQNAYAYKLYQNKQEELDRKYEGKFLNIQPLFHGFEAKFLRDICRDNLDFRLHDNPKLTRSYGEGTYFFISAAEGANLCTTDFMGNKHLLVADVIVGEIAEGKANMTRPPENPALNNGLFDTTVDNVLAPSLYVKYSRQEYYPTYIVEFN